MRTKFIFYCVFLLLITLLVSACDEKVNVGIQVSPAIVEIQANESVNLSAQLDPPTVKGKVEYKWSATDGMLSKSDGPVVEFTAPPHAGQVSVSLEVIINNVTYTSAPRIFQVLVPTPTLETVTITPTNPPPPPSETPRPTLTFTLVPPSNTPGSTATLVDTAIPASPTPTQYQCPGNTSSELTAEMWRYFNAGIYDKAMLCAQQIDDRWSMQAELQQQDKEKRSCRMTPDPEDKPTFDKFWVDYWALNDVAISWFVRGEIFKKQGQCVEARQAYNEIVDKYSCAFAWDPQGWFWSIADGAASARGKPCP